MWSNLTAFISSLVLIIMILSSHQEALQEKEEEEQYEAGTLHRRSDGDGWRGELLLSSSSVRLRWSIRLEGQSHPKQEGRAVQTEEEEGVAIKHPDLYCNIIRLCILCML